MLTNAEFAEQMRQCVICDKKRETADGREYYLNMGGHTIAIGSANVTRFIDCTHYEYCRPGGLSKDYDCLLSKWHNWGGLRTNFR